MTRKGEQLYALIGPVDLGLFDGQGPTLQKDDIYNECVRIIGLGPRVDFINATLTKYEHGVHVDVLQYKTQI